MLRESWQLAEIPGPKKALVFAKPEVVVTTIQRSKRPLLVVGHDIINNEVGEEAINLIIRIANESNVPVVATAHVRSEFVKKGFNPAAWMSLVDFANRLQDKEWKGLDGAGNYDLVLFVGIPYPMGWLIFSSLKHFSSDLTTASLDGFYQPNATCSFSNLPAKKWIENLRLIANALQGREKGIGKSGEGSRTPS